MNNGSICINQNTVTDPRTNKSSFLGIKKFSSLQLNTNLNKSTGKQLSTITSKKANARNRAQLSMFQKVLTSATQTVPEHHCPTQLMVSAQVQVVIAHYMTPQCCMGLYNKTCLNNLEHNYKRAQHSYYKSLPQAINSTTTSQVETKEFRRQYVSLCPRYSTVIPMN